jgi:hypothetical protein
MGCLEGKMMSKLKIRTEYQLIETDIRLLKVGDLIRLPTGAIRTVSKITDKKVRTTDGTKINLYGIGFVRSSCVIVPKNVDLTEYQNRIQSVWKSLPQDKSVILKGFVIEDEEIT